ncbi:hypothetical protein K470DRAFT_113018 [Piedraia hortae CBS 480.64]|uniref:Uncharacterized protein n=1 Tax=Piedraia hortae CBS 480.64 TaxID=1314780 RepID=A0A6A7BVK7_9PEZI|nr:hypothetical protein K470DRAFT_113018 [Piedraia hortae CBS 480.64]
MCRGRTLIALSLTLASHLRLHTMPFLNQVSCSIGFGLQGAKLKEHGTKYIGGMAETYIAVPDIYTPFSVHVQTHGYIAPGLAVAVYIDGIYQCNRNHTGLRLPGAGVDKDEYETEFVLRQKEVRKTQRDSGFIGRGWTFARARSVVTNQSGSNDRFGTIDVFILRCTNAYDGYVPNAKSINFLSESFQSLSRLHLDGTSSEHEHKHKNSPSDSIFSSFFERLSFGSKQHAIEDKKSEGPTELRVFVPATSVTELSQSKLPKPPKSRPSTITHPLLSEPHPFAGFKLTIHPDGSHKVTIPEEAIPGIIAEFDRQIALLKAEAHTVRTKLQATKPGIAAASLAAMQHALAKRSTDLRLAKSALDRGVAQLEDGSASRLAGKGVALDEALDQKTKSPKVSSWLRQSGHSRLRSEPALNAGKSALVEDWIRHQRPKSVRDTENPRVAKSVPPPSNRKPVSTAEDDNKTIATPSKVERWIDNLQSDFPSTSKVSSMRKIWGEERSETQSFRTAPTSYHTAFQDRNRCLSPEKDASAASSPAKSWQKQSSLVENERGRSKTVERQTTSPVKQSKPGTEPPIRPKIVGRATPSPAKHFQPTSTHTKSETTTTPGNYTKIESWLNNQPSTGTHTLTRHQSVTALPAWKVFSPEKGENSSEKSSTIERWLENTPTPTPSKTHSRHRSEPSPSIAEGSNINHWPTTAFPGAVQFLPAWQIWSQRAVHQQGGRGGNVSSMKYDTQASEDPKLSPRKAARKENISPHKSVDEFREATASLRKENVSPRKDKTFPHKENASPNKSKTQHLRSLYESAQHSSFSQPPSTRGGKSAPEEEYTHRTQHPLYIDSLQHPYVSFRFMYRSINEVEGMFPGQGVFQA